MITRRPILTGLIAAAVTEYPAKARRFQTMLTAAPAGSSGDEIARSFAHYFERLLDGPEIQVKNMPGDGGRTALKKLADAPPTGSTIGWVLTPVLPARAVDRGDPGLPSRIALLGSVLREPIAFVACPTDPLASVRDMIERANQDAGGLTLGTPPPGSPPHLAVMRLQAMTQTRLNIIPFPSAAAARQALLGGNVTAAALGLSDVVAALRDEKLVGVGIAARNRSAIFPEISTLGEAGVPLSAWIHRGLAVPVQSPSEAIEPLVVALLAVTEDPMFRKEADSLGLLAAWSDGPSWQERTDREIAELTALWIADPWLNAAGQ